jgi:predicted PurR-regulated permease PerM
MSSRPDLTRATLGVLLIVTLLASTVWILRPFLGAIIWAAMIVVATWPMMRQVQGWLWGSRRLAVAAMTAVWLLVVVLPLSLAIGTIVSNAGEIMAWAASWQSFSMPPPPEWLSTLPLVGTKAVELWQRVAASPIGDLASAAAPYAAIGVTWTVGTLASLGGLLVQFVLTLAVSAVMYTQGEGAADGVLRFGRHLAGEPGDHVVRLAARAIRSVALGVVVTAMVQAALGSVGLVAAGVPFAALLTVLTFVLCIAQIGPALVLFPSVGWLYWQGATGTATALLLWTVVVVALDNIMRPILMTRGANLPLLLMFAGVIGGLLAFGLIGIFVGPVVLAVSYTLMVAWMGDQPDALPTSEVQ